MFFSGSSAGTSPRWRMAGTSTFRYSFRNWKNSLVMAEHSCALFMNDNVATQIDGLGHATEGADDHWYNGFAEKGWGGNWGPRKCDASTIPPIVARGVLIDA